MKTDTPRPIYLKDYRPPEYLIPSVDLDIALAPHETRVRSRLKVRRNPKSGDGPAPLHLDGVQLHLDRLTIDGVAPALSRTCSRTSKVPQTGYGTDGFCWFESMLPSLSKSQFQATTPDDE